MKQKAKILKIDGEMAEVEIKRHTACEKCGGCNMGTQTSNIIKAKNNINAKEGEQVYLSMENMGVLKAASIMYMIPLFAMIVGFMFSYYGAQQFGYVETKELWGLIFGLVFLGGSFLIIRKVEPKFAKNTLYSPEIIDFANEIEEDKEVH